ncbi:uncharacterized protein METZ01_LOCUS259952 [marine metagenome]|uniref:Uncharacterized protein n=1 Tax=marine metagenome TaxID=408172 RepID=A0A382J5N0_9ZZZZ
MFIRGNKGERLQAQVSNGGESECEAEIDINRTKPLARFAFESFVARSATFVHGRERLEKSPVTATRTAEAIATPEDIDELPKHSRAPFSDGILAPT